jgi:hypothetical protein
MQRTTILFLVKIVLVILIIALVAQQFGLIPNFKNNEAVTNPINTGARNVQFTDSELQTWLGIKDRLAIINSDPEFTGNRVLQWISMRNSSSGDYYQKSMEYLCFWEGQGANGEWEAVVSIYNSPNSTSDFVVEVARFTWHEIQVKFEGVVMADFLQVSNDTVSTGYCTFHVGIK